MLYYNYLNTNTFHKNITSNYIVSYTIVIYSWHRCFNKNSGRWRAVLVKEKKEYVYIPNLLAEMFKSRIEDTGSITRRVTLMETDPRRISSTIAPVSPKPTSEIVAAHVTRKRSTDHRESGK